MSVPAVGAPGARSPRVYPSVVHLLIDAAAQFADREAIVVGQTRLDYRAYLSCVAGFAHELAALGVQGQRVAILLPNSAEICIATFAAHMAGAQVVPLNPLYTERELEAILRDAEPRVLIHDTVRAALVEPLAVRLSIPALIALEPGDGRLLRWASAAIVPGQSRPAPTDLAFVQYTGGTTGRSKGVNLTHAAVAINISQREAVLPISRDGERILCVMPLFHTYALSMGLHLAAYCGGTLVVLPRYHPQEVLATIERERISIFPGSPTLYTGLMNHPEFEKTDFSQLHTCYSGSAALPLETLQRWEKALGCKVYEGYGQTEAGPILTFNPAEGERKPGSVGIALQDTEIEIVDLATGTRRLSPGERGEIRARGPQLMSGYRNLPEETAAALREGWLYSGDIGEMDAAGYLTIRDRKKDMVIVGGYNVYPREVEDVLAMHPAVLEAGVIGVADAYRGEAVAAFVALRPGAKVRIEALAAHCAKNLAKYKLPATITIVDALPKTSVNKTDKNALRAAAGATSKTSESRKPGRTMSEPQHKLHERLTHDHERGELRDGEIHYIMMRPDALMGLFKHLPPVARAEAFAAMARSIFEHGGKTGQSFLGQGVRGHDRLLQFAAELSGELGWGVWRFTEHTDQKLVLEVTNSPFAAGFGQSGTPVCAPIVGMLRAVAGIVFGRQATASESACAAQGNAACRFEARPLHIGGAAKQAAAAAAAAEAAATATADADTEVPEPK